MTKQRQRFSTEFKLEVMALVTEQGYSIRQAAEATGVASQRLINGCANTVRKNKG